MVLALFLRFREETVLFRVLVSGRRVRRRVRVRMGDGLLVRLYVEVLER